MSVSGVEVQKTAWRILEYPFQRSFGTPDVGCSVALRTEIPTARTGKAGPACLTFSQSSQQPYTILVCFCVCIATSFVYIHI